MPDTEPSTDDKAEVKDWPASLKLSAAVDELAVVLYHAYTLAYSKPRVRWHELSEARRATFRAAALTSLETLHGAQTGADLSARVFDLGVALARRFR